MSFAIYTYSFIIGIAGMYFFLLGGYLVYIRGSSYYVIYGAVLVAASYLLITARPESAAFILLLALAATILWSVKEVGFTYWPMFPRILVPLVFSIAGVGLAALWSGSLAWFAGLAVGLAAMASFFALSFRVFPEVRGISLPGFRTGSADSRPDDWTAYARTTEGTRYSPKAQIDRTNVKHLQLAWSYRTGRRDLHIGSNSDQNTPLAIGGTLYVSTPQNAIHAIDVVSGKRKWVVDDSVLADQPARCRGLGHYRNAAAAPGTFGYDRIVSTTVDGRLRMLDAETGAYCTDFGDRGIVDLAMEIGQTDDHEGPPEGSLCAGFHQQGKAESSEKSKQKKSRLYWPSSAPLVAGDHIVIGGWVTDNQSRHEPSGVIRAFDARTGTLSWVWDLGDPATTREPPAGQTYTLGTPNMWTHASYDAELGLVYCPLGNAPPDYYGVGRSPETETYSSSLVALDVRTGRPRWHFQTVHHDLWDYDLPSQPALVDMRNDQGEMVPAVIQLTKRGQIFALDRRTGEPIARVEERPVTDVGHVPGEALSPTQPYSVDMPAIGAERLTEAMMWGMTSFDQLLCRIDFRRKRYDGDFTPPGLSWHISHPGAWGGLNWGSASHDPINSMLFVNDLRVATIHRLLKREDYNVFSKRHKPTPDGHFVAPMLDTPYGVTSKMWLSPLGVPCIQPPFGTITAINLQTRKIAWQRPADTAENLGPFGLKLGLPMRLGCPTYAGTLATAGGLLFFAGGQDNYLRAFDSETGEELWKARTPVGSSATPMTFVAPDGRQYVILSNGGAAHSPNVGDYILAYALPQR